MEPFLGHGRASSPSTPHLRSRPPEWGSHQRRVGRQGCSRALRSSLCPGVDHSSTPPRWFCPNLGQRECGQLRSVIRESPSGRPGDLRDGPANRCGDLRGSVAQGILWSAGSVAPWKPPQQSAERPATAPGKREKLPARLPNSPARRREGDATASHPQVRLATMVLRAGADQKAGGLTSAQPIVEEERRAHKRSHAHQLAFIPPATFQVLDRPEQEG